MKIPKPHLWAYEACAAALPDDHPARARAAKALAGHQASHKRKLERTLEDRKEAAADHRVSTGATRAVRSAVATRAAGRCECCGAEVSIARGHMDHFFGRHAPETAETCWFLCSACDLKKTTNVPTRLFWLLRFKRHCQLHSLARAHALLEPLIALEQGQWGPDAR